METELLKWGLLGSLAAVGGWQPGGIRLDSFDRDMVAPQSRNRCKQERKHTRNSGRTEHTTTIRRKSLRHYISSKHSAPEHGKSPLTSRAQLLALDMTEVQSYLTQRKRRLLKLQNDFNYHLNLFSPLPKHLPLLISSPTTQAAHHPLPPEQTHPPPAQIQQSPQFQQPYQRETVAWAGQHATPRPTYS